MSGSSHEMNIGEMVFRVESDSLAKRIMPMLKALQDTIAQTYVNPKEKRLSVNKKKTKRTKKTKKESKEEQEEQHIEEENKPKEEDAPLISFDDF